MGYEAGGLRVARFRLGAFHFNQGFVAPGQARGDVSKMV